jgi:hypothetical protein
MGQGARAREAVVEGAREESEAEALVVTVRPGWQAMDRGSPVTWLGEDVAARPRGHDRAIVGGNIEGGDGMVGHRTIMIICQAICKLFPARCTSYPQVDPVAVGLRPAANPRAGG